MAHFYGTAKGMSTYPVTRCGSKKSGLTTENQGAKFGIKVEASVMDGKDTFIITLTGGREEGMKSYGRFKIVHDGPTTVKLGADGAFRDLLQNAPIPGEAPAAPEAVAPMPRPPKRKIEINNDKLII